jgi:hypothetical protein
MITLNTDKSRWDARYQRILSRRVYARRVATIENARSVCRIAYNNAPVDTGRFKKNLAEAANRAGVGPLVPIKTKRSKFADRLVPRLAEEAAYWTLRDNQYQAAGRTDEPYYRKILKNRNRAELELRRFEQTEDAIVINAFGGRRASVRYKVYIGRGRIRQTQTRTIVEVHNTEAHASIVEKRHKVMASAIAAVKSGGGGIVKLSKRRYLEALGESNG